MATSTIYALVDPRTDEIRYVGKSINPQSRCLEHLKQAKKHTRSRKLAWIRSLLKIGLCYQIQVLEDDVPKSEWIAREQHWIKTVREQGHRLTNLTDGGDGGKPSLSSRRKMSRSAKAAWANPVVRQRFVDSHNTPEALKEQSERSKKFWFDPVYRSKKRGSLMTTGGRASVASKARKRWSDPAFKEVVLKKVRESCTTTEFREKMAGIANVIAAAPGESQRRSKRAKKRWSNPEFRSRVTQAIRQSRQAVK